MGSLISLLDNSTAGLIADQNALNVTSNNVANQNTTGYVRQIVNFSSGDYVTLGNSQESSTGPTITVTSARNLPLERQIQSLQQTVAASTSEASVLTQIQDSFGVTTSGTTAGSTQLGTTLDAFFASLTALAGDPSNEATRQGVISAASTMANAFNSAASGLAQAATSANSQISDTTDQVNALTQTVATLNGQIAELSPKADAGSLEDQRQTAIEQLSQYIGLNQTTTENNMIALTTTGGTSLVNGQVAYTISSQSGTANGTEILDQYGNDITRGVQGGSLGGLLAGVNTDIPNTLAQLNSLAFDVDNRINAQNSQGVDLDGNRGGNLMYYSTNADSAATLAVNATPDTIAAAAVGEGTSGNGNALLMAAQGQTGTVGDLATDPTYDNFLSALIAQVGTSVSSLTSQGTAQQAALAQLTTQRDSQSAVSLDQEASNLTQYQRSYEAAAKVFTIADTLMADAINLGVESSVS